MPNCSDLEKKLFNGGENPFASITNQIICKHRFKKKSLCFELEVKEMAFIVCVCVWHFHSEDLSLCMNAIRLILYLYESWKCYSLTVMSYAS